MTGQCVSTPPQKRWKLHAVQPVAYRLCLGQGAAHGGQVTRPAPVQAQPRQRTLHVRHAPQQLAQPVGERPFNTPAHRFQPLADHRKVARRRGDPPFQQPRPARCHRPVDHRQQRSGPPARHGRGQFEVPARRGVDLHQPCAGLLLRGLQQRQPALLRDVEIIDQRAHGGQFRPGKRPEPRQGLHREGAAQALLCRARLEGRRAQHRRLDPQIAQYLAQGLVHLVGNQHLRGGKPRQFRADPCLSQRHHVKRAGGDIRPRQRPFVSDIAQSAQEVVPPRLQQRVLRQRARRHQPHHVALHHRLVAALLRLFGTFELFAHRNAESLADQRQQIALRRVHRDAAHRDVVAVVLAAFRQGDVQRLGRRHRVVKEHLVEVTHPVEQQRVGVLRLDLQILCHHRCDVGHGPSLPLGPKRYIRPVALRKGRSGRRQAAAVALVALPRPFPHCCPVKPEVMRPDT